MRTLSSTLSLITLVAGSAALAQAQSPVAPEDTASSSVRIRGVQPAPYKLDKSEFDDFKGRYLMSDGSGLTVRGNNKHAVAEIDGKAPVELVPVGYKSFVARNGDLELKFDQWFENRTSDVVMRMRVGSDMVAIASR